MQSKIISFFVALVLLCSVVGAQTRVELNTHVDERGYLAIELQELADSLKADLGDVERVLSEVQKLDPPGIAARDLHECLIIQARSLDPPDPLVVSILEEAFDFLQQRRIDKVGNAGTCDKGPLSRGSAGRSAPSGETRGLEFATERQAGAGITVRVRRRSSDANNHDAD